MLATYPDDMVVTNPLNQMFDKQKVLKRAIVNIIRYSSLTEKIEYFRL